MKSPAGQESFTNKHRLLFIRETICIILVLLLFVACCCFMLRQYLSFFHGAFIAFFSSWRRRRSRRRRFRSENNPDEPSMQTQSSTGLASAVIHSLPALQYRKDVEKEGHGDGDGDGDDRCAICLHKFHTRVWLRLLPNCAHVFHVTCIDPWFRSHSTCPLCRTSVLYDFSGPNSSVSTVVLLETLQREEVRQERPLGYRLLQLQMMRNPEFRMGAMASHPTGSESDESFQGLVSPVVEIRPSNQRPTAVDTGQPAAYVG